MHIFPCKGQNQQHTGTIIRTRSFGLTCERSKEVVLNQRKRPTMRAFAPVLSWVVAAEQLTLVWDIPWKFSATVHVYSRWMFYTQNTNIVLSIGIFKVPSSFCNVIFFKATLFTKLIFPYIICFVLLLVLVVKDRNHYKLSHCNYQIHIIEETLCKTCALTGTALLHKTK